MNAVLQRHGARYIFVIPEGLKELMMDISREVLRSQPTNIYTFIADYCDALMITRENTRIATQVIDNVTDCSVTIVDLLQSSGMTREEADNQAYIIHKYFREYLDCKYYPKTEDIAGEEHMIGQILRELDLPRYKAEKAQIVIKSAWNSYKERQKLFESDVEFVNWRKALQNAMFLYRRTGIPEETARRAASKIQAAYRGYYTRRYLKRLKNRHDKTKAEQISSNTEVVNKYPPNVQEVFDKLGIQPNDKHTLDAIIKIQYNVRKYLGKQFAKRLADDIMHNITENLFPDSTKTEATSQVFEVKEPLINETYNIYSENEEALYEVETYSSPEGTFASAGITEDTSTYKSPATALTNNTISEITEPSSVWDHSDDDNEK